jgi:ABC-type nitrate/sulfonate/bicarbonate transport system substrate-binding protein
MLLTIDSRKRVPLGRLLPNDNVSLFNASVVDGRIILEPMRAVPDREAWLYDNPEALASVLQGLKEAGEGKVKPYRPLKQKK